jgi:hypothetical protein
VPNPEDIIWKARVDDVERRAIMSFRDRRSPIMMAATWFEVPSLRESDAATEQLCARGRAAMDSRPCEHRRSGT